MDLNKIGMKQQGSALIVALFFIVILTVIGLSLLLNTSTDNVISNNYAKTVRATYAANSGVERFKAYLLYDFKHDPNQWSNRYLVVPQGSRYLDGTLAPSAVNIGGSGSDAYFDLEDPSTPNTAPSSSPYRINPNIPYVTDAALYAEQAASSTNPIVTPGSAYQLMIRNVAPNRGDTCTPTSEFAPTNCDPANIYVIAIGRTTTTKSYLDAKSKGMNLVEVGINGDDISVWNNIFFANDNSFSGGGAMTIHGNVHTLGPNNPPPYSTTTVFDTAANVLNTYYMTANAQGRLEDPLQHDLSVPQQRYPGNITDTRNKLGAKFRVRNGLARLQGSAYVGTTTLPFDVIATCFNCDNGTGTANGFTSANPDIHALRIINYNIPQNLQNLVKVPAVTDAYKDPATNINYPTYTDYFIGMEKYPYITGSNFNYPGAMGLKLATALGPNNTMAFDDTSGLATQIWAAKAAIFANNVSDGINHLEQRPLDPLDTETGTDPLFNPIIGSGGTDGKTYMIVAVDTTQNVVIVYKEVAPFQRNIDNDPSDGLGSTSPISFPRVVHGFVFVPYGANMATLRLKVDIDGDDVDGGLNWIFDDAAVAGCGGAPNCNHGSLDTNDSNRLVRRVANSLWKASRGECGFAGPCYDSQTMPGPGGSPVARSANDFWEPSMEDYTHTASRIHDMTSPQYLKVTPTYPEDTGGNPGNGRKGKLIAYGAIETTDTLTMGRGIPNGSSNGIVYAGRFTLFSRNSDNAGTGIGYVTFSDNAYPIASYEYPSAGKYIAFPCQNNMGIMAANDIDHSISPHDEFAGAFYAGGVIHMTRQEQILGAMVATGWDFAGGGNPDFYQAMEMSRCLPPYIVAKDPIVYADSQSWIER